jgi:site-specific DNA recombinase
MSVISAHPAMAPKAIIYCRVSSARQKIEGSGLESQEHRCRQYAALHGYEVEAVFPDDASGGGDFMKRPGMVALLYYLDAQPDKSYVVIFDDLKSFARDTEFHIKLRREFRSRHATIECLNFRLEDSPEGQFVETIFAAQGQLEREQNRRQVVQKMQARVEKGYAVFQAPVGYRYERDRVHGKILVRDEPLASIVQEALEGFASGRFSSQTEVKRFLELQPAFPKDLPNGEVRFFKVTRLLKRTVYSGCVEAPGWGVSIRKGQHEGLVSFETFQRIQDILEGRKRPAARKDYTEDFPARGFVQCDDCGQPMTACWSKGKHRHYAYYLCDTRSCPSRRKSVPRAKIEDGLEAILRSMQPTPGLFAMAKAMFVDIWNARLADAHASQGTIKNQLRDLQKQIDGLMDRIVEAESTSVVKAYEKRIDALEREKIILAERASTILPPKGKLEESIEHALAFLSSPWNIWKNGSLAMRQSVLRLAFVEPLRYSGASGYRTPEFAFPFRVLAGISTSKCRLVEPGGIEPPTS